MNLEKLSKLFEFQKILRDKIIENHKLQNFDLRPNLILGLNTELAELANETRCFKHWSVKPPSDKKIILEEFVDVLHFILEVGLSEYEEYGHISQIRWMIRDLPPIHYGTLTEQFNSLFTEIGILNDVLFENCYSVNSVEDTYNNILRLFEGLGEMLGFTWDEIEQAYVRKNKINHQRQAEGY